MDTLFGFLTRQTANIRFGNETIANLGNSTATISGDGLAWRTEEATKFPQSILNFPGFQSVLAPIDPVPKIEKPPRWGDYEPASKPAEDVTLGTGAWSYKEVSPLSPEGMGAITNNAALLLLAIVLVGLGVYSLVK